MTRPSPHLAPPLQAYHLSWTLATLAALLAWDATGADLALARLFGDAHGFALRDHWLWSRVLHEGMRPLGWLVVGWLGLGLVWPLGVLRRLDRGSRVQLLLGSLASLVVIQLFKHASTSSCPWDLRLFGGVADHVSHWAGQIADGGPGHCFPAGHASAGFAFFSGYFVLRPVAPRWARRWLLATLCAGLLLGLAQQVRGAHFMSHTGWTAWLCWSTAWLLDVAVRLWAHIARALRVDDAATAPV